MHYSTINARERNNQKNNFFQWIKNSADICFYQAYCLCSQDFVVITDQTSQNNSVPYLFWQEKNLHTFFRMEKCCWNFCRILLIALSLLTKIAFLPIVAVAVFTVFLSSLTFFLAVVAVEHALRIIVCWEHLLLCWLSF